MIGPDPPSSPSRLLADQAVAAALRLAAGHGVPIEKVIEVRFVTPEERQRYESGGGVWVVIMAESLPNAPGDLSEVCLVNVEDESGEARFVDTL